MCPPISPGVCVFHNVWRGTLFALSIAVGEIREQRRRQFLEAARELFIERGYEATTVREVTRMVGVSLPTFYRCYRNKDDLIQGLIGESLAAITQHCIAAAAIGETPIERMSSLIRAGIRLMAEDPVFCAALKYWFGPGNEAIGRARFDGLIQSMLPIADALHAQIDAAGLSRRKDPMATFSVILCTAFGYCARKELWEGLVSAERVADAIVFLITEASGPADGRALVEGMFSGDAEVPGETLDVPPR